MNLSEAYMKLPRQHIFHQFRQQTFFSAHIFNKLFFRTFVVTNYFFQFFSRPPLRYQMVRPLLHASECNEDLNKL